MKRTLSLIISTMLIILTSCEQPRVDTNVRFYVDGQEITNDSISVLLNTYQEIGIKAINQGADWHFYWLKPTGQRNNNALWQFFKK